LRQPFNLRRMPLRVCCLFIAMIIAGPATASDGPTPQCRSLKSWIAGEMRERHIVGAAVAVVRPGKLSFVDGFGHIDLEGKRAVTKTTLFSAASITKSFTGVAVMTLVEAGKVQLDDPIGAHLEGLPLAWRDVPVRRLLNHTSGLPDMALDAFSTRMLGATPTETLTLLSARPMKFPIGEAYEYNQTSYFLLGWLIEKHSGMRYADYIEQKILRPAGARFAEFGDAPTMQGRVSPVFTPFRFEDGKRPTVLDHVEILPPALASMPRHAYPAGGLNISVADFSKWLSALLDGQIISPASLKELWSPAMLANGSAFKRPISDTLWDGSGLGWVLGTDPAMPFAGGTRGIRSAFFYYPKDGFAVIALTNTQRSGPEQFVAGIADCVRHLKN